MLKFLSMVLIFRLSISSCVLGESRTNFDVISLSQCHSDGPIKFIFNFTKENHKQYLDFLFILPIPLGSNIGMTWSIEHALSDHNYLLLFTIREKDYCKALNKYIGQFWYDMEQAAQIPPRVCPILPGRYRLHHYSVDYNSMALQTFPFGTLRFTLKGIDNRSHKIVSCVEMVILAQSRTNFDVMKLYLCPSDGPLKFSFNFTKENQKQYLDLLMIFPIPLDNNIGMTWTIESALDNHTYMLLFTIREKYCCKALNKYMGEFWYDMERAAQMPPGVCPIIPGRYHLHHHLLNFNTMALQTFPFGVLRFTVRAIDKRNKKIVMCVAMETKNLLN